MSNSKCTSDLEGVVLVIVDTGTLEQTELGAWSAWSHQTTQHVELWPIRYNSQSAFGYWGFSLGGIGHSVVVNSYITFVTFN